MLFGLTLTTLGLQSAFMGILAQVFFDYSGDVSRRWLARMPYTRMATLAAGLFTAGLALTIMLVVYYLRHNLHLDPPPRASYLGVIGILLMIVAFTVFTFTLLLHATEAVVWRRR